MSSPLDEFFATTDLAVLERVNGWEVVRDTENPDVVRFAVRGRDQERYIARFESSGYPDVPPSVVFVNEGGSKDDPKAWPLGDSTFHEIVKPPPHCFLCMPLTREGLAHHPDWKSNVSARPWSKVHHTLLDLFNFLSRWLNCPHYVGRGGK